MVGAGTARSVAATEDLGPDEVLIDDDVVAVDELSTRRDWCGTPQ